MVTPQTLRTDNASEASTVDIDVVRVAEQTPGDLDILRDVRAPLFTHVEGM